MENPNYQLEILAHRQAATELTSPILGFMEGRTSESMTAEIVVHYSIRNIIKLYFKIQDEMPVWR